VTPAPAVGLGSPSVEFSAQSGTRRQDTPTGRQRIESGVTEYSSVGGREWFWRRLTRDVLGWKYVEVGMSIASESSL